MMDTTKGKTVPAQGDRTPRARREGGIVPAPLASSSNDGTVSGFRGSPEMENAIAQNFSLEEEDKWWTREGDNAYTPAEKNLLGYERKDLVDEADRAKDAVIREVKESHRITASMKDRILGKVETMMAVVSLLEDYLMEKSCIVDKARTFTTQVCRRQDRIMKSNTELEKKNKELEKEVEDLRKKMEKVQLQGRDLELNKELEREKSRLQKKMRELEEEVEKERKKRKKKKEVKETHTQTGVAKEIGKKEASVQTEAERKRRETRAASVQTEEERKRKETRAASTQTEAERKRGETRAASVQTEEWHITTDPAPAEGEGMEVVEEDVGRRKRKASGEVGEEAKRKANESPRPPAVTPPAVVAEGPTGNPTTGTPWSKVVGRRARQTVKPPKPRPAPGRKKSRESPGKPAPYGRRSFDGGARGGL